MLVTSAGPSPTKVGDVRYWPFGNRRVASSTSTTDKLFTGQQKDSKSGLYYLRARYYDPSNGRFMSQDPLSGFTGNDYRYAGNSPATFVDPAGTSPWGGEAKFGWWFLHIPLPPMLDCGAGDTECFYAYIRALFDYFTNVFLPAFYDFINAAVDAIAALADVIGDVATWAYNHPECTAAAVGTLGLYFTGAPALFEVAGAAVTAMEIYRELQEGNTSGAAGSAGKEGIGKDLWYWEKYLKHHNMSSDFAENIRSLWSIGSVGMSGFSCMNSIGS